MSLLALAPDVPLNIIAPPIAPLSPPLPKANYPDSTAGRLLCKSMLKLIAMESEHLLSSTALWSLAHKRLQLRNLVYRDCKVLLILTSLEYFYYDHIKTIRLQYRQRLLKQARMSIKLLHKRGQQR